MANYEAYIIIGAGPSGLAAGYELSLYNKQVIIYEKLNSVGGLARTIDYKKCKYDIGPHRFYTLNNEINKFYNNILGKDVLKVNRLTRILYNNKFFLYPLSPFNTLLKLGFIKAFKILISFISSQIKKYLLKKKIKILKIGLFQTLVMNYI